MRLLSIVIVIAGGLCTQAFGLTSEEAEARLRMALQIAREHNSRELVKQVEATYKSFQSGLPNDAEMQLQAVEKSVGIDPGGWSMAGQPLAKPTPELVVKSKELAARLNAAMQTDDPEKVRTVTAEMLRTLGDQAGVPDGRRIGRKPAGKQCTEAEAAALFLKALKSQGRAMRELMAGQLLPDQMMRIYGYVLESLARIRPFVQKYQPGEIAELDLLADGCAKVLLTFQQQAGHFPFPDLRGKNIRFGDMINRQLKNAAVEIRDGWVITPDPDGGTQFDTGVCGVALLKAGVVFQNESWLAAGKRAAEWALQQKCCGNFNYNAFSVSLLAQAFGITKDERFRLGALQKFRVGVAPGQAPNGRWMDAHNARTVYHIIILRALGDLASVMSDRAEVDAVAQPAIKALLDEFDSMGITVEALPELLTLHSLYPEDQRLTKAVSSMASSLIEKSTDGTQVKMGAQPNQLAAVAEVSASL